jgi:hypothetical protein
MSQEQGAQAHPAPSERTIHKAPNAESVAMYRNGIPTSKIASSAGVEGSTVRYHLGIAAPAEPDIKAEHKAAKGPVAGRQQVGCRTRPTPSASMKGKAGSHPAVVTRPVNEPWPRGSLRDRGRRPAAPSPRHTVRAWPSFPAGTGS